MVLDSNHGAPIGIFDSGVGGLSVLAEVVKLLPYENLCYMGDTAHCPYGSKSYTEVQQLTIKGVEFLLSKHCKLIVIACNTATSAAIEELRRRYTHIQFVGMEPAVKPAALHSLTKSIGVLATARTVNGRRFRDNVARNASDVKVNVGIGYGLVELVEQGLENSDEAYTRLQSYLEPMLHANIDQLVLGCTHYPFLIDTINKITQGNIEVVQSGPAVARQTQRLLEQAGLLNTATTAPHYEFYSSGNIDLLRKVQQRHVDIRDAICSYTHYPLV